MSDIPETGEEMRLLVNAIVNDVRYWTDHVSECLSEGCGQNTGESEKRAYEVLAGAIKTDEERKAFSSVLKNAMLCAIGTMFVHLDQGIDIPDDPDRNVLCFDVVNRETRKSIFTWSADEEFQFTVPYEFWPFPYES